jgi:hypothetical protein
VARRKPFLGFFSAIHVTGEKQPVLPLFAARRSVKPPIDTNLSSVEVDD